MGLHSKYTGTYYVKCDAVNCCKDARIQGAPHVKNTYYITQSENGDVISHAIDYEAPGAAPGRILYGNFTVKHLEELDAVREVFKAPDACLANNVLHCNSESMEKWDAKFQARSTAVAV